MLGDDSGSVSGESLASEEGWSSVAGDDRQTRKKSSSPKNSRKKSESKSEKRRGKSKGLSQKEREMKQKMYEYRSGLANMPAYDVIQNSVHVQTGNIDLQFFEDSAGEQQIPYTTFWRSILSLYIRQTIILLAPSLLKPHLHVLYSTCMYIS